MDKKDTSKLLLSIIMGIILILLLNVDFTGLFFHNFFTIVFLAMLVYHIVLNRKWIKAVTKNLTNKNFKTRYKVIYILNLILGLSFIVLLISEAFIYDSGRFNISSGLEGFCENVHNAASMAVLVLASVHAGIHLDYFIDNIKSFVSGLKNKSERKVLVKFALATAFVIAVYIPVSYYAQRNMNTNNSGTNEQNSGNRDFSSMFGDQYEGSNGSSNGGTQGESFGNDDLEEFFREFQDQMDQYGNQGGNGSSNSEEGQSNSRF